ncbi:MAG: AAA family ATPase [Polyangiaceae bacterium]
MALPRLAAEAAAAAQAAVTAPRRATGRRGGHELSFQGDELTLDRGRCPVLCALGRNLTAAAAAGELDDVVARGAEIEHVLDVLAKRTAPSACLVGPAGVGKTAVARGVAAALLAHAEATGTRPRLLVELVSSELVAGTGARGALAERLAAIRAEVRGEGGRVVLFVDDVHELVGGGAPDEATAELKLGLARGELTLLGATTPRSTRRPSSPIPCWRGASRWWRSRSRAKRWRSPSCAASPTAWPHTTASATPTTR